MNVKKPEPELDEDPGVAPATSAPRAPGDRGQSRKPLNKSGELMKSRPVRMTDAEWQTCMELGGAAWIRARIKAAAKRRE